MLFLIHGILNFALVSLFTEPQSLFVFFQFEIGSDKNKLEMSNEVLLSETKLEHVITKASRVYSFVKRTNI